jgi:hypothetical protein
VPKPRGADMSNCRFRRIVTMTLRFLSSADVKLPPGRLGIDQLAAVAQLHLLPVFGARPFPASLIRRIRRRPAADLVNWSAVRSSLVAAFRIGAQTAPPLSRLTFRMTALRLPASRSAAEITTAMADTTSGIRLGQSGIDIPCWTIRVEGKPYDTERLIVRAGVPVR